MTAKAKKSAASKQWRKWVKGDGGKMRPTEEIVAEFNRYGESITANDFAYQGGTMRIWHIEGKNDVGFSEV